MVMYVVVRAPMRLDKEANWSAYTEGIWKGGVRGRLGAGMGGRGFGV